MVDTAPLRPATEARRMEYDASGEGEVGASGGEGRTQRRSGRRRGRVPRSHGVGGRSGGGGMDGKRRGRSKRKKMEVDRGMERCGE